MLRLLLHCPLVLLFAVKLIVHVCFVVLLQRKKEQKTTAARIKTHHGPCKEGFCRTYYVLDITENKNIYMDYSNSSNVVYMSLRFCTIMLNIVIKKKNPLLNYRVTVLNYVCNIGVYTIYYSIGSNKMIRNAN